MTRHARRAALLYGIAAGAYLTDRLSKLWAEHVLATGPFIGVGPFRLAYTTNSGGAFGIGQRAPLLFAFATLVVVGAIVYSSFRLERALVAVGLGLLLGGALGNLTDRLVRAGGFLDGRVVDFIDVRFWPVFNLADSAVVIGAVLLAVAAFVHPRERPDPGADRPRDAG